MRTLASKISDGIMAACRISEDLFPDWLTDWLYWTCKLIKRYFQGRCVICGGPGISDAYYCKECTVQEKDRDGCPKIVNLGSSKTDLFYEMKKYGFKKRWDSAVNCVLKWRVFFSVFWHFPICINLHLISRRLKYGHLKINKNSTICWSLFSFLFSPLN